MLVYFMLDIMTAIDLPSLRLYWLNETILIDCVFVPHAGYHTYFIVWHDFGFVVPLR